MRGRTNPGESVRDRRREPSLSSELAPPAPPPPEETAERDVRDVLDSHDERLRKVLSKLKADA